MSTVLHEIPALQQLTRAFRREGRPVVLVPTMGALHEGHLSLVKRAQEIPDAVVIVSIFVNPLQFAAGEDLESYPRTLEADVEKLEAVGADYVFAPNAAGMYPHGPRTTVLPGDVAKVLEGASRPTHFAGVLTVVNKLFHISRCTHAIFGEKDYQQLLVIRQMVADLNMDVDVIGAPIVRDEDGLAKSSRNAYLSPEQRKLSLTLSKSLRAGADAAGNGAEAVVAAAQEVLAKQPEIEVDYLELRNSELQELDGKNLGTKPARLLVAARVGTTRLIDNIAVRL